MTYEEFMRRLPKFWQWQFILPAKQAALVATMIDDGTITRHSARELVGILIERNRELVKARLADGTLDKYLAEHSG